MFTKSHIWQTAFGADELEDGEFLPFYEEITPILQNKKVALFGSYEWNDGGPWMDNWYNDALDKGLDIVDTLRIYSTPTATDLEACFNFGQKISN